MGNLLDATEAALKIIKVVTIAKKKKSQTRLTLNLITASWVNRVWACGAFSNSESI